jgi:hypothetical protein
LQAIFTHAALGIDAEDGLDGEYRKLLEGCVGLLCIMMISVLPAALI